MLSKGFKHNFIIPHSSASYAAYLLNNLRTWTSTGTIRGNFSSSRLLCSSQKLLLILKRYMLYYSHQWRKSANDYREFLTLIKDHTDDDNELINLLIKNNKELQSTRPPHTDDFFSDSRDIEKSIIIRRNEFF